MGRGIDGNGGSMGRGRKKRTERKKRTVVEERHLKEGINKI